MEIKMSNNQINNEEKKDLHINESILSDEIREDQKKNRTNHMEYMPDMEVLDSDIDKQVIDKAKTGLYNEKSIASVPEDLKKKYFTKIGPSYQISNDIKSRVEFKQHNLLKDTYPDRCDLIVCRNVLIYFTEEAKDEVFRKFNSALKPDGILFIGSTEQIMNYKEINYERKNSFFYVKAK